MEEAKMVVDKLVNQLLDNVGSDASNNSDVAADILINCANSSKFYIPEFTSPNIIMSTIHQMVELSSVTFGANSRFIIVKYIPSYSIIYNKYILKKIAACYSWNNHRFARFYLLN